MMITMSVLATVVAQTGVYFSSTFFSSGLINDLRQDRQGSLWIATDYGLNRFDGYHYQTFLHTEADSTSLVSSNVVILFCDSEGQLWVGTSRGLDRFEPASETFYHYPFPGGVKPRVSCILQRRDGSLLVGTAGYGVYTLDNVQGQLQTFSFPDTGNDYYSRMLEDSQGRLWKSAHDDNIYVFDGQHTQSLHSDYGTVLNMAERNDEVFITCQHGFLVYRDGTLQPANVDMSIVKGKDIIFNCSAIDKEGSIYIGTRGQGIYHINGDNVLNRKDIDAFGVDPSTSKVNKAMFDRQGNLWLALDRKGLLFVPQRPMQFASWNFDTQGIRLGSTISSVCEGDDGITWCTVQGVGVYGFDRHGRVVAHPASPDAAEFIFRDKQQRFWLGTDDGLFSYNPLTGKSELRVTFDCDKFNDMTDCGDGNIYISTFSRGFCAFNPQTGQLRNYRQAMGDSVRGHLCNDWVMAMMPDKQGRLWLATASGVSCFDPSTESFLSEGWPQLLDGVMCFALCETTRGHILIGTEKGLYLYDPSIKEVERFRMGDGLAQKVISYIVESNNGDLWCSTSDGIWQYSVKKKDFIGHVNGNGLVQKEYIFGVGMHSDDDLIYFGQNDGLTVFSPRYVGEHRDSVYPLQLTGLRVGDQYVKAGTILNDVLITDKALSESDHFTLSYLDHTVTLAFSQFSFDNPMNVTFEYRVNGGPWISVLRGVNEFTLGHLEPGNYEIDVRASQDDEYTDEKHITIHIQAPWYRTTLAYIIYVALILALLFYMLRTYRRRAHEKLDEEKMKFLINATHDIRSPLTLIKSPLANLKRRLGDNSAEDQRDIETIEHNTQRILNLVNQILDVRKIDKQQMHLHCQQTELVTFCEGICKMFDYNARERQMDFRCISDVKPLNVWIDRRQMDKVVTNLLSNAFKYTPDAGSIELHVSATDSHAVLHVIDSGTGLDADNAKHIFDRFYQGKNSRQLNITGTGIGLNLCKMIVDMHHGTIEAQNRTDGTQGSIFTVQIPLGNAHLSEKEIEQPADETVSRVTDSTQPLTRTQSKYHVLVVDDDPEIANYIVAELGRYYKFGTAENGKDALKKLLTGDFDVVVSDVMMPEMDGFSMLRIIKTNANISHIPVIMLTSMADVGNRLEGLERGADAFLAKPFDMEELHMNIENQINTLRRLRGKFSGAQQQADKVEMIEVKGNDEELMERIMKVVNKHLSDSDFTVDVLTQEACISRTQLHRKMKEMTGLSTSEFIRNLRLEQAARLLKEKKINVTQVAYTVGFSNLAHFSTVFRKHFGMTPSEYSEQSENS